MPLVCLNNGELLKSFGLTDDRWTAIKTSYRGMSLSMRCCSSPAIPKVSSLGTRFFAHKSRARCQTAPESPEHLQAKFIIAESAEAAGWRASTEESGTDPDGNTWIADVICTRRKATVAFEVQLVTQSLEVIRARQERYRRSGIRGLWLIKFRGRKSAGESCQPCRDLPMVFLDVREPANITVEIGGSSEVSIPLADFVKGALTGKFLWAEPRPGKVEVKLQIASIKCWRCHLPIKVVRGYVLNDNVIPLSEISDTGAVTALTEQLRRKDSSVTPVSRRYSKTRKGRYFAASCPFCSALMGDWFMIHEFFFDVAHCEYPNCTCSEAHASGPELGCRVFEYHGIILNVGRSELVQLPPGEWKWRPFTLGAVPSA